MMIASRDPGFDASTGHYYPVTLKTAGRDPIPDRSQFDENWKVACQSQAAPIWNLLTPSRLNFGLVSASMQGAVRQGLILESLQWSLEMIRTDGQWTDVVAPNGVLAPRRVGKGESNMWKRFFIICAEDIALANPFMITFAAQFIRNKPVYTRVEYAERAAITMATLLARSMKSRVADYACICRIDVPEAQMQFDMSVYFNKLVENLLSGNHVMAIGYAEGFIVESLRDKDNKVNDPLPKANFTAWTQGIMHRGSTVKYYKNKRQLIWVALLKVLSHLKAQPGANQYVAVTEIIESCYDLAHDDKFRWGIPSRLFGRMAILALCMKDSVEARGLDFKSTPMEEYPNGREFTYEEIGQLIESLRNGNLWYGVSDVCKDKHCLEGKNLGRGIQHFIEIKSFLRYEDPLLKELNDFYLKVCFQTRYVREFGNNAHFDHSGINIAKYIEWLPRLREQQNRLDEESRIKKE